MNFSKDIRLIVKRTSKENPITIRELIEHIDARQRTINHFF